LYQIFSDVNSLYEQCCLEKNLNFGYKLPETKKNYLNFKSPLVVYKGHAETYAELFGFGCEDDKLFGDPDDLDLLYVNPIGMRNQVYLNFMRVPMKEKGLVVDSHLLNKNDVIDLKFTIGSYLSEEKGLGLYLLPLGINKLGEAYGNEDEIITVDSPQTPKKRMRLDCF
jgi:hypothetical protein